jgi:hypothetical protein
MRTANVDSQSLTLTYTQAGTAVATKNARAVGVNLIITNSAPAAGTFTADSTTDLMTKTAHGFATGLIVQVSTTTTLPAGLSAATNYYVIYVSANTYKLATSNANALAGTAIDLTTNGTGTHTVTPTALAGASVKLQGSMDNTNWADLPIIGTGDATKSASITTTQNNHLCADAPAFDYIRCYYTMTSGQLAVTQQTTVKE